MIVLWLTLLLVIGPDWHDGLAVRYSEGVMRTVARNRGIEPQPCMVAYTYARDEDMGRLWLEIEGVRTGVKRRCLAIDLPRPGKDKQNLIRRGILIELDAESSRDICGAAWSGKASACPVRVRVVVQKHLKARESTRWAN